MGELEIVELSGRKPTLFDKELKLYLHSRYDPVKEAQQFAEAQYDGETQNFILYGFGLGYAVAALAAMLRENQRLSVFELRSELPALGKRLGVCDWEALPRTQVITPATAGGEQLFMERFRQEIAREQVRMILHMPSVKAIHAPFEAFRHVLEDWNLIRYVPQAYQDQLSVNREENRRRVPCNVFGLKNRHAGYDAILVAAGPSLNETLPILKAHLDSRPHKTVVIAVGRVLKSLLAEGIRPDYITVIDPTEAVYRDISGLETLDIPMVLLDTTYHPVAAGYQGPKYLAVNRAKHLSAEDPKEAAIATGGSVATLALACAVLFGCGRIFFFGQDLGSYGDRRHFDSEDKAARAANTRTIPDYKGEPMATTLGLLSFKRWIERVIADNPHITFYNVSLGANIHGTVHLSVEQFLEKAGGRI